MFHLLLQAITSNQMRPRTISSVAGFVLCLVQQPCVKLTPVVSSWPVADADSVLCAAEDAYETLA